MPAATAPPATDTEQAVTAARKGCERCGPGNVTDGRTTREKYTLTVRAAVTVRLASGATLDFCDNHYRQHADALDTAGATVFPVGG